MPLEIHADPQAQAAALAAWVAGRLRAVIAARGTALLVVPGGSTPRAFLERLAAEPLPWAQLQVALTDERRVPQDSPRRNESLVARALPQARLLPMLDALGQPLPQALAPADVLVLGMGEDGHVASLFPGSRALDAARTAPAEALLEIDDAPGDEPRVSRTYAGLRAPAGVALLITGEAKRRLVEVADPALPVTAVLAGAPTVFWAPAA